MILSWRKLIFLDYFFCETNFILGFFHSTFTRFFLANQKLLPSKYNNCSKSTIKHSKKVWNSLFFFSFLVLSLTNINDWKQNRIKEEIILFSNYHFCQLMNIGGFFFCFHLRCQPRIFNAANYQKPKKWRRPFLSTGLFESDFSKNDNYVI